MKPSAVLLIDLENFYCSREDYCGSAPPPGYDRARFAYDLDKLLGFARSMVDGLPFTVRRAYANFNAARYPGGAPPQYYLRHIPDEFMRQGVEPVQVFRLSQSSSKNAADMRMAMDATALLNGVGNVEHFVLVTGDADFIPVILELKRHGHAVSVIGVTGATNALIQRFVDNFELFEDLLAAEEVEARSGELTQSGDGLAPVVAAVRKLLARTHPLRFAAVKPLLSKELGHAFDPGAFGCDTTGEFLRKYQTELGVVIRPTLHDQEIDLPGSSPPNGNGSNGSKVASRPPVRPPEKQPERAAGKSTPPQPEPHSREHYHQLLTGRGQTTGTVRVPTVPWAVLVWGCDAIVDLLAPPTGMPTHTTSLLPKIIKATDGVAIPDIVKHLRMFYPILRAGLPGQNTDGVYSLAPGTTGEQIRRSVLSYIAYVLNTRFTENHVDGTIRADSLAAVFDPGAALEQATAEVVAALAEPPPAPAPEPAIPTPKTTPNPEEFHTSASYMKLLKGGGAKGSETESFKILPVPWASMQRVCLDVFPMLSPADGGAPTPRDQLYIRLTEAGKDLYLERYDQHVRRTLGMLRVAGDVIEEEGVMALNADIASAQDLRHRTLVFLLELLQLRLEERDVYDPIRPRAFAEAFEAGSLTEALVEEASPLIQSLYREAEAETQPVETAEELLIDSFLDSTEASSCPDALDSGILEISTELEESAPTPLMPPSKTTPASVLTPSGETNPASEWAARTFGTPETLSTEKANASPVDKVERANEPNPIPASEGECSTATVERQSNTESPLENTPLEFSIPIPVESPSAGSGIVDVASITSEAVAAAAIEIPSPPVTLPIPPAPRTAAVAADTVVRPDDDLFLAVPVADWIPDGGPVQTEGTLADQLVSIPPGATRLLPPGRLPDPVVVPVANIALPLLSAAAQSPPSPPPPPSEPA